MTNNLGNVLSTISDKRWGVSTDDSTVAYYNPDLVSANDYYPFGMLEPGRQYAQSMLGAYRYGFNGKEQDNEVKGTGNQIDYGMRVYDPRLGKFLSIDPLTNKYPMLTPYQYASNNPATLIDIDGGEGKKKKMPDPEVIGSTPAKLKIFTKEEIEQHVSSLDVQGLSKPYLKALVRTEGAALNLYDMDRAPSKLKLPEARGGNATIGIGHLVHYGAIGSTQYDANALDKESPYLDKEISVDEVFSLFSKDLKWRVDLVNSKLKNRNLKDADQGVVDVLTDLLYNSGDVGLAKGLKFYQLGGALRLYQAIEKNVSTEDAIKSIDNERKDMRLRFLSEPKAKENFQKGEDDIQRIHRSENDHAVAIYSQKLNGNRILFIINYLTLHEKRIFIIHLAS